MINMRRRTFLATTGAGLAGLTLGLPEANAQATYAGPFWVFIHASGGWDPQFLFNPTDRKDHNRLYTEVRTVGNIPYATWELDPTQMGLDPTADYSNVLYSPRSFLEKYGKSMTVVNGIDFSTNNHDSGTRVISSGKLTEGYPALGAMVASVAGQNMPLAFLAGGGYDATMGLVPAVRLSNVDVIQRIVDPNLFDPNNAEGGSFHTEATWNRIRARQKERLKRLNAAKTLPIVQQATDALKEARSTGNALRRLSLPEPLNLNLGGLGGAQGAMRQAQLASAAFKNGLAISAGLSVGGFDTHGDHDRAQPMALAQLLAAVGFTLDELGRQGLRDKTYVVVTSDFGRGPAYNGEGDGSGKDHWPISSVLAFGPKIAGNRVVGDTDSDQRPLAVDPGSLKVDKKGVVITPQHVNIALRRIAGFEDSKLLGEYPLLGEDLRLFG